MLSHALEAFAKDKIVIEPKIIVHGGAGPWTDDRRDEVLAGVRTAVKRGADVLHRGGSALDAVEAATIVLEDHPLFDAGIGSFLNDHGEVEMDALITDGSSIRFGAVAGVRRVLNPIILARHVMTHTRHCFFVAEGAEDLAVSLGMHLVPNLTFITDEELAAFRRYAAEQEAHALDLGTVGAVAIDAGGHIASATSTGGMRFKKRGRVGDSPIFGAGGYSDDRYGAASATGVGENIMRFFLSKHAVDALVDGITAQAAAETAISYLASQIATPEVGLIIVDAAGRIGAAHSTGGMPVGWIDRDGQPQAAMRAPYHFE
jgi:beta-aspartyl-peptidase (threonine type)